MLYRKDVFNRFLLTLCDFVSSCSVKTWNLKCETCISETARAVRCSHQQCRVVTEITNIVRKRTMCIFVIVFVKAIIIATVFIVLLFCKDGPERAVCGCSFAGCKLVCRKWKNSRRHSRASTDALQKRCFPPVFVKSLWLCVFVFSKKVIVNVNVRK